MRVQPLNAAPEEPAVARHSDLRNTLSLDSLNFFLADVRDGLGPYLAIYLLAVHKWDPASIGVVMTLAGIAALLTQGPAGALIDRTHSKRAVIAIAAILVTLSCLLLPFVSSFSLVALTQAASAVAASVFAPAISAISLGITGPRAFTRRTGRNETFNHAGNATAALLAGGLAYLYGPVVVFYLMAFMALASVWRSAACRPAPSTMTSPAVSTLPTAATTPNRPACACYWQTARCWCSPSAAHCSTWPTLRCCRWSAKSSRKSTCTWPHR